MSKIECLITLVKDNEYIYDNLSIKGIKTDKKFIYKENNIHVTIVIEDNKIIMKRSTSDYIIELNFINNSYTIGSYYLNEYKKSLKLDIKTNICTYDKNKVYIDYYLNMEKEYLGHFVFSLESEV